MDKMKKVGLFGGSFDPPTKAHLQVAEQLIERGVLDEVEFVPAYMSYHGKDYGATPQQRIDMLYLLIESSKYRDNMTVNTFEIDNKMKSSTCDFVVKFLDEHDIFFSRKYYFIIGADNAKKIPNFINAEKLISLIPFIIVNRGSENLDNLDWCNNDNTHTIVNIGEGVKNISSSYIRECIYNIESKGLPVEFNRLCSMNVFAYILNYQLYGLEE